MHIDPYIVLGSAVVGFLVGMTGAGGGALMTPMLILLFGVQPSAAISSDLVAAVVMRPIGAAVHLRRRHGEPAPGRLDGAGLGADGLRRDLPAARTGRQQGGPAERELALGVALLVGAAALVLRYVLDRRTRQAAHGAGARSGGAALADGLDRHDRRTGRGHDLGRQRLADDRDAAVPLPACLGANQLVGTDLTQAVPLTLAAALGALAFGHVEFGVTASLIIGSVPAVFVGSLVSSSAPDRYIRPVITFVIAA